MTASAASRQAKPPLLIGWSLAGETIDAATLLAMAVIVPAVAVVVTQR